jgi:signal transduction histidine kinase
MPLTSASPVPVPWYQGTGTGLALVRGIVQLHGGKTHLISTVGSGSRFSMLIPLTTPG